MTATLGNSCLFFPFLPLLRPELLGSGRTWCRPPASCPADQQRGEAWLWPHTFCAQPTFTQPPLGPPPEPVGSGAGADTKRTQQRGGNCVPDTGFPMCSQPAGEALCIFASFENVGACPPCALTQTTPGPLRPHCKRHPVPFTLPHPARDEALHNWPQEVKRAHLLTQAPCCDTGAV